MQRGGTAGSTPVAGDGRTLDTVPAKGEVVQLRRTGGPEGRRADVGERAAAAQATVEGSLLAGYSFRGWKSAESGSGRRLSGVTLVEADAAASGSGSAAAATWGWGALNPRPAMAPTWRPRAADDDCGTSRPWVWKAANPATARSVTTAHMATWTRGCARLKLMTPPAGIPWAGGKRTGGRVAPTTLVLPASSRSSGQPIAAITLCHPSERAERMSKCPSPSMRSTTLPTEGAARCSAYRSL